MLKSESIETIDRRRAMQVTVPQPFLGMEQDIQARTQKALARKEEVMNEPQLHLYLFPTFRDA